MFFIHISLPAALIISAFILLYPTASTLSVILAVALHEIGHLILLLALGERVDGMTITPFGLIIHRRVRICPPTTDLWVHLAGPAANLILFLLLYPIPNPFFTGFAETNLFFGLLNLLPVSSLDGGQALAVLLSLFLSDRTAVRIRKFLSFGVLILLWLTAIYFVLFGYGGTSLLIFCIWLFASVFLKGDRFAPEI
ncbi:MAG: hypothetical protein ACI3YK_08190 [Eubacteriales bacterium]